MIRTLLVVGALAIGAAGGYFGTLHRVPIALMDATMDRARALRGGEWNVMSVSPRRNMATRVVKSNPDIIAASCMYNLADGPVHVHGRVSPHYWSLSVFRRNSDNIFVTNDRALGRERYSVLIKTPAQAVPAGRFDAVVDSTSRTGILVNRLYVPTEALEPDILAYAKDQHCEVIRP